MARTKRHPSEVTQFEHQEDVNAKRVKIVDTEMSINLNHKTDCITTHPAKLSASALGCDTKDNGQIIIPPLDCSSIKVLMADVEGVGDIEVQVSLSDTENHWITVADKNQPKEIVARRVRVKSMDAIGNVHLVGRS